MKKKIITITLLSVFVAVVICVYPGYGRMDGCGGGYKKGFEDKFMWKAHMALMNQDKLGLSDEQTDRIKDLKIATKKNIILKSAQIEVLGIDIKAALWEDTIDTEKVNALVDQKYELKKQKTKELIAAMAEFKTILTAEQEEMIKELCSLDNKCGK